MYQNWEELEEVCNKCNKCKLCNGRKNIVFGTGNKNTDIMFIGEGPGSDEDIQGEPFVGKAGQLLDRIFASVGLSRQKDVYICNTLKNLLFNNLKIFKMSENQKIPFNFNYIIPLFHLNYFFDLKLHHKFFLHNNCSREQYKFDHYHFRTTTYPLTN